MSKYKFLGFALGAALMLSPLAAFAATISNPLFSNGQTTIDATGGATVSGTFTLTVGPGEVVEWLRTQSDPSQPFVDTSVGGSLGYQEQVYTNVPFSVKVPPNTGTYAPTVQGAGIYGGNRSINGGDSVVLGATGLGTIRVVANAEGSTSTGGSFGGMSLADLIAALKAAMGIGSTPAPVADSKCSELAADMAAGTYGVVNDGNVALQGFLLADHESIPALKAGAAFGFWGPQTQSAISAAKTKHSCN